MCLIPYWPELCPASEFEEVPSHSGLISMVHYADLLGLCVDNDCLGSALCSNVQTPPLVRKQTIPWKKAHFFWSSFFLWTGWTTQLQIWHRLRSAFYLSTDTQKAWFPGMICHFWYHSNQSLFMGFSERSRSHTTYKCLLLGISR
jgi:hypothetical protein